MAGLGRLLVYAGVGIATLGLALWLGGHLGLGRLPGDIRVQRGPLTFYAPLASGLVISLALTLLVNLLLRR